uniref:Condensin complex subunit 1 n=1 Tax=Elaeophora elaphi TaxID=1147741 RepID=A0A158Q7F5_9BILA
MCAFVAVHAGAGTHPHKTEDVCLKAVCKSKGDIVEAVKELENDFRTNCGFGSNLTFDGHVECEAAFTSSKGHVFGAVGMVSRLRNPIEVAAMIAREQFCGDKKFVLPTVLVGRGAEDWARKRGIALCDPTSLISKRSQEQWREAREIVKNWEKETMDTVGAVSYENGDCNAACSSGGMILKAEGRLGHTVQTGGAIWADQKDSKSIAIALSGCGEYISQTLLAKTLAETLFSWNCEEDVILDKIKHVFNTAFLHSPYLQTRNKKHILAGGLVLFVDRESGCAELVSFHNTAELTFAFFGNGTGMKYLKKFVIPSRDDDLLEESDDFYTIRIRPQLDEIISKVFQFRHDIDAGRWSRVIDRFDHLFFTVKPFSEGEPWRLRAQLISVLNAGLKLTLDSIEELLPMLTSEAEAELAQDLFAEREMHARAFLMYIYLLCRLAVLFEKESSNRQSETSSTKKGRKTVSDKADDQYMIQWMCDRGNTLKLLRRAFSMNSIDAQGRQRNTAIRFLWQPSIVPPELLKISKDLAYKFLENPELSKVSGRDWLQAIFGYLKVICIDYSEVAKVGAKLVNLMKRLDYLSLSSLTQSPFVDAIESVSYYDDMDTLFQSMLSALSRLSKSDFARSDVSARPFALFIVSLAEKKPYLLNKHIVNIAPFLSDDPATLRCAVLTAFVEIVMVVYKGNLPEGNFRRSRDRLLLHLQDHTVDVNAVVRSRALQLWTRLARASQIPIVFISGGLIRDAGGRLIDKSVSVRRSAATFLSAILEYNPFGASLNADDLADAISRLEAERLDLKNTNPEKEGIRKACVEWASMKENLIQWITKAVKQRLSKLSIDASEEESMGNTVNQNGNENAADTENIYAEVSETNGIGTITVDECIIDDDVTLEELITKIVHALENRETCRAAIEVLVRAALDGRFPTVNRLVFFYFCFIRNLYARLQNGSADDIIRECYESLQKMQLADDEEMLELEDRIGDYQKAMEELANKIKLHENAIMFSLEIENCMKLALRSVMYGQANELTEIIHFIVEANKFGIRDSEKSVRELFKVVWRRDNAVKEIIINAARDLFISANKDRDVSARRSAENLIKIVVGIGEEERVSVEEVLCLMARENRWDIDLLDVLSAVVFETQGASRIAALRLFSIICRANKEFMRERLNFFIELTQREGFFDNDDGALAAEFFNAVAMLGSIPNIKDTGTLYEPPFRLPETHRILQCVHAVLVQNVANTSYNWLSMMQKAVNTIFYVAARPSLCCRLIASGLMHEAKRSLAYFFLKRREIEQIETINFENPPNSADVDEFGDLLAMGKERSRDCSETEDEELIGSQSVGLVDDDNLSKMKKDVLELLNKDKEQSFLAWETVAERVCAFAGQIALKTLVHTDVSFVAEMKRKNEILHDIRATLSDVDHNKLEKANCVEEFSMNRVLSTLEAESVERHGFFEVSEQEEGDRLGLTGISEEERILERAQRMCENAISRKGSLLHRLSKFLVAVVKSKKNTCSEKLRSTAILALSKFMLLSMKTCVRFMPLFLEYFKNSPSSECRSNLMIAIGDLCFRFPNVIEKYSEHLYHGINDKDDYVRQTSIIVLSYLMLNDMVKVRGTVADLAQCVNDENVHVGQLAKFFFSELAKKGNILYNLMPDMISRLSCSESVTVDDFIKIMKLLLAFIKKDKQADSLLEKLIQRMQGVINKDGLFDMRLAECLSHCISCLPLSEKSFRFLAESLPAYSNLLILECVFTNLQSAVLHFKKYCARNTELKGEIDDFLESLTKMHHDKQEHEGIVNRGLIHRKKCKAPMKLKKTR